MNTSPYNDTDYPQKYFEEYLQLIYKYRNILRSGIFIRYYKLNREKSIFREDTNSTYTPYTATGLVYDIYEYTPTLYVGGLQNTETFEQDSIGKTFPGMTSVTVYTINHPNIDDLVQFYPPYNTEEIFRVSAIRLQTGIARSPLEQKPLFFELDIEYAPIDDISQLNVNQTYVYDISLQDYLTIDKFQERLNALNNISDLSHNLNKYYNKLKDIYLAEGLYAPCFTNELLIEIKRKYNIDYNRIFESLYLPYYYDIKYQRKYTLDDLMVLDPNVDGYVYCYDFASGDLVEVQYPHSTYVDLNTLIDMTVQLRDLAVIFLG